MIDSGTQKMQEQNRSLSQGSEGLVILRPYGLIAHNYQGTVLSPYIITRVAPHCVNTLKILDAAYETCPLVNTPLVSAD